MVEQMHLAVGPYYNKLKAANPNGPRWVVITHDIVKWRGFEKNRHLIVLQQYLVKVVYKSGYLSLIYILYLKI